MSTVYLNGAFKPLQEATIPVLDRGFIFGDGVYEVIPVFNGKIFSLTEHLERLELSLAAISIINPCSIDEWNGIIEELLDKNDRGNCQSVYLQITRGVSERDHIYRDDLVPTVFLMCKSYVHRDFSKGVPAVTHPDIRWQYCHIKATSLLPGVILKNYAKQKDGSFETILIRDGYITEGAASNVFVIKGDSIRTPEKNNFILAGITRDLVVDLLREAGFDMQETLISEQELLAADEIWVSSSTMGIVPVVRLDGRPVGQGLAGPVWKKADAIYESFKDRFTGNS